jgi:aldose sugar dehydrogenase
MKPLHSLALVAALVLHGQRAVAQQVRGDTIGATWVVRTGEGTIRVTIVDTLGAMPSAIAVLPDGSLLVADRVHRSLTRWDPAARRRQQITGMPTIWRSDTASLQQGAGLHDVRIAPDFDRSRRVVLSYSAETSAGTVLVVDIARLQGTTLSERRTIYQSAQGIPNNTDHFGGRVVWHDGRLYITSGDRYAHRDSAQQHSSPFGKILRVNSDGTIPRDNPFLARRGADPAVWSIGHRNPQGLAVHPLTGELWSHEHGPQGGDEVNRITKGSNYGWPLVSYGEEYEGGPVNRGERSRAAVTGPVFYYKPSIAPSDLVIHSGAGRIAWRGNFFVGGLGRRYLSRLVLEGTRVLHEEALLADRRWRIRALAEDTSGALYLGVDGGLLIRVEPVDARTP